MSGYLHRQFKLFVGLTDLFFLVFPLLLTATFFSAIAYGAQPIKIGILAYRPKPQTITQWKPLEVALKTVIPQYDFEVKAFTFSELEAAVAQHQVDFVLTNPGSYIMLAHRGNLSSPLATLSVNENGAASSTFGGVIFCKAKRNDLTSLSDIRGKVVSAAATESFGGYLAQAYELSQIGIHLPADAKLIFSGMPHDKAIDAVLSGKADLGFVRTGVLESLVNEGRLDINQIKILNPRTFKNFPWLTSTPLYPEWTFSALINTEENLARHVAAAFFLLEENKVATQAIGIHGFVVPADYTPVERILKELRLPPFDSAPEFTLFDVWNQYRFEVILGLGAIIFIILLGLRLALTRRILEAERNTVLRQKSQIQESETYLKLLIENEPECIKVVNAEGKILQMNSAGLSILEADRMDQVIGQSVKGVIAPESRSDYLKMHKRVIAGESLTFEFEILGIKGRRRLLETHAVPMIVNGQTVQLAITRDVTEQRKSERKLLHSFSLINATIEATNDAILVVDLEGHWILHNHRFIEIWNIPEEIIASQDDQMALDFVASQLYDVSQFFNRVETIYANTSESSFDLLKFINGNFVERHSFPQLIEGKIVGRVWSFRDVTEQKIAEDKLRYSEQRFRDVSEAAGEYLWEIDTNMVYTYVSARALEIKGYSPDELLGHTLMEFMHEDDCSLVSKIVSQALEKMPFKLELRNITKDGLVKWEEVSGIPFFNSDGDLLGLRGTGLSIDDRKANEEKAHRMAFYDPLTNLPNRRLLYDRLEQSLVASKRSGLYGALMFIDLDNFKPLNDAHGHLVGDLLLVEATKRLQGCVREVDTVARFGGDEFVVILNELDVNDIESSNQATLIAEKIRNSLSAPYIFNSVNNSQLTTSIEHRCTSSIGVIIFNQHDDRDQLLKLADSAMYEAKKTGKNRVIIGNSHSNFNTETQLDHKGLLKLNWLDAYSCGNNKIDDEHRDLFALANTLFQSSLVLGKEPSQFQENLDSLIQNIQKHFNDEEAILAKYHYIDLDEHKKAHIELVNHILLIREKFNYGALSMGELVEFFVNEVVINHLLTMDKKYFPLISEAIK